LQRQRLTRFRRVGRLGEPTAAQWAIFWSLGDVNLDGVIDSKDMALLQYAFNSTPGSTNWIGACDLNHDGVVDIFDTNIFSQNFGLTIWDYFGLSGPSPDWFVPALAGSFIGILASIWLIRRR